MPSGVDSVWVKVHAWATLSGHPSLPPSLPLSLPPHLPPSIHSSLPPSLPPSFFSAYPPGPHHVNHGDHGDEVHWVGIPNSQLHLVPGMMGKGNQNMKKEGRSRKCEKKRETKGSNVILKRDGIVQLNNTDSRLAGR